MSKLPCDFIYRLPRFCKGRRCGDCPLNKKKTIGVVTMTLDKAKEMLEEEYKRAKTLEYIQNPLAYALFNVWRKADMQGRRGRPRKE